MSDLFKEIIPSILQTKDANLDLTEYKPFIVNRALSYHLDCIPYVSELNLYPGLDKDMQYQFLLNTIRPMKRKYQAWQKADTNKDLDCVKEYFGYSNQKAKDALKILSDQQITEIRRKTDKGGVSRK